MPCHRDFKHLIEVAIVKGAVPSHADERTAHEGGDGCRIEVLHQQVHVLRTGSAPLEEIGEALDRHVGEREQPVKLDIEVIAQLPEHKAADPEHTAIFAILQRYNRVNLLVPVGAPHMYHAAVEGKSARLTALGEHYRRLVKKGLL